MGTCPYPFIYGMPQPSMMKQMDYGKDYKYAHNYDSNFVLQQFLPDQLEGKAFYSPQKNAREEELRKFLKEKWKDKYGY